MIDDDERVVWVDLGSVRKGIVVIENRAKVIEMR